MGVLNIGTTAVSHLAFTLPDDLSDKKIALLATIAGVSARSAYDYIYWMTKNGVVRAEGKQKVVLCQL